MSTITIKAEVSLLSTSEGGRKYEISGNMTYRPHLCFSDFLSRETTTIGGFAFKKDEKLYPGQKTTVDILLINSEFISSFIEVNQTFSIYETNFVLGTGKILEVY